MKLDELLTTVPPLVIFSVPLPYLPTEMPGLLTVPPSVIFNVPVPSTPISIDPVVHVDPAPSTVTSPVELGRTPMEP